MLDGLYQLYAKKFVQDFQLSVDIKKCDGNRNHEIQYTFDDRCPLCGRETRVVKKFSKMMKEELKGIKLRIDEQI